MGLVGSLDDLGLGEILQIISLSGKSGVLSLSSPRGKGSIVFCNGLIQRSRVTGGARNLGELLQREEILDEASYQKAFEESSATGMEIEVVLEKKFTVPRAVLDELRRKNIEDSVLEMFQWMTGDFCFEVEEMDDGEDPALALDAGLNAQFLAMEGSRRSDEARLHMSLNSDLGRDGQAPNPDDPLDFSGVGAEVRSDPEPQELPIAHAHSVESLEFADVAEILDESMLADAVNVVALAAVKHSEQEDPLVGFDPASSAAASPTPASSPTSATRIVVAVDSERKVLEWVKGVLEGDVNKLHLFSDLDSAMRRIRQYVLRREWPLVIVSDGFPKLPGFLARLRKMAPKTRFLMLGRPGAVGEENPQLATFDFAAVLERPSPAELGCAKSARKFDATGEQIREVVLN